MSNARIYTDDELKLVRDVMLSARQVALHLGVSKITVDRLRKKLDIKVPLGIKQGSINLKTRQRVTKTCIGKDCINTFEAGPLHKKKYCCHACQARTVHIAPKGKGSRSIRNPNIKEYKRYAQLVHALSHEIYIKNIDFINPNRYPRTLCGIEGGWQLDHIKTIKECFQQGMPAIEAACIDNLRMLPWKTNLMRQYTE
jgi:hypothetical protein